MGYFNGLVEGFNTRRGEKYKENVAAEEARRASEGKVYEYLLQSRDPEISSMALTALIDSANPVSKAKGIRGFMGEVEGNSMFPQIRALMDQMVPNEDTERELSSIAPPARPGSAAMSGQSMVDPDNQNDHSLSEMEGMQGPPPNTIQAGQIESTLPAGPPGMAGATAMGLTAPPESRFKRRGTGVPTAEEIAESNAAAGIQGRIRAITEGLRGAPPEMIQRAVLGIAGAPLPMQRPQNVAGIMAVLPDGRKVPVSRDAEGNLLDDQGNALPEGTHYERTAGGSQGSVTATVKDTPQIRAQYQIDPNEPNPSGYWRIQQRGDGSVLALPAEYSPPPAYSGTTTITDDTGNLVVAPINRGGGTGAPLGNAPPRAGDQTDAQANAKAFLLTIDKEIAATKDRSSPVAQMRKNPTEAEIDAIVQRLARANGLPYTKYFEVQRAAQRTGTATAPDAGASGSVADRVRARIEAGRQEQAAPTAPAAPTSQAPPVRVGGPGPQRPPRP